MFQTQTVPFPGTDWIDQLAENGNSITIDGTQYSSAYDALLNGNPLENPCRNFNAWVNSWLFGDALVATLLTKTQSIEWTHYILCYLRNFVGAMVVYYGTAGILHYFCYIHPQSTKIFDQQDRPRPSTSIMWHQIQLSQASMTLYVLLPVVDEWLVENQITQAYHTVDEIGGWTNHLLLLGLYFSLVELGIYWMHRTLHTNKWLYKHVHLKHHYYNAPETLTPWASIAFHPLDGILQASPYVIFMFVVPCHYPTHFGLLFFTALWATYIHDAMDFNFGSALSEIIMGSKYHTVHHTHYIYNYGQVFTICDRIFGTLRVPQHPTGFNGKKRTTQKKVA